MISSGIKRFILATSVTAVAALSPACATQQPGPKTAVAEIPASDEAVQEDHSTAPAEATETKETHIQQNENTTAEEEKTADNEVAASSEDKKPVVFPIPTEAEGTELLQYENVSFEADVSPMPDIATTVRSARKNSDSASMFITHMMYRDNIGDIAYYNHGKKQETELSKEELHREMIRWRNAAYDANFELAMLATNPSVVYETSPLFSDDDEYQKSLKWLKKAAAHGYGNAEYILGLVYFNGVGVKRDKKKGFELLVRAAAHGVINAYYAVGMIYEMGLNGKKDTDKSHYWLEKAVHFGSKDATFILAMKYYDGIDVPKDIDKGHELEKLDPKYHAWIKLINIGFYHKYCTFQFDESAIGRTHKEYGGGECGEDVTISRSNSAGFDEDKDDYSLEETAAYSLDYKIDYLIAAKWLRKVSTFERDYSYILHAQTHHITGCRGDLDGHSYDDIVLYPDEYDEYDYDDYSTLFQKFIIALTDDETRPSKLKKILMDKVEADDPEAINLLGNLYN
ncbi:MAG: sel1 repeat family protein, partial [Proteobacteria bacterium]|nr:sel1 repeat family protein [Pseudomonadota bacterium]